MECNGAQWTIRYLEAQGVRIVFGIPGGNILPLYDALVGSRLEHVLARHEQGAGFMAQGYARTHGDVGVCFATSGPGATNLLTALADAWRDSVPVLAITGQVPSHLVGTDAFQEVDICAMAKPCVKSCFRIHDLESLRTDLPKAWMLAQTGRPGPVLVDIPKDILLATMQVHAGKDFSAAEGLTFKPRTSASEPDLGEHQQFLSVAEWIASSKRPLLYFGGGIRMAGAAAELRALVDQYTIPAVSTLQGLGCLPSGHPMFLGMLGMHGTPVANLAVQACDLLIAVGARFDDRAAGDPKRFAPEARVVHIDLDAREIGKLRRVDLGIRADARHGLAVLRSCLSEFLNRTQWQQWWRQIAEWKTTHPLPAQPAHEWLKALAHSLPGDVLVTTDVGQHQMWAAQAWPLQDPRQMLTSGGLGTMGFGLPAAIGASLASPGRTVACVSGDGSILMNIQELATLSELGLPVKILVFHNSGLGMVRQQQELFFEGRFSACRFGHGGTDCVAVAKAFGIPAVRLENPSECRGSRAAVLLASGGPALLEIAIPEEHMVWPMIPGGKSAEEMLYPADFLSENPMVAASRTHASQKSVFSMAAP